MLNRWNFLKTGFYEGIKVVSGDITHQDVGAIVVNLFQGVESPEGATGAVDGGLDGAVSQLIEDGEISGKLGEATLVHTLGKMTPARVLVAGLGKREEFTLDTVRRVTAESCRRLRRVGVETVATIAHGAGIGGLETAAVGQAVAEGAILGLYRFNKYKSPNQDRRDVKELTVVEFDASRTKGLEGGIGQGTIMADAVNFCRDRVNEPANFMTPTQMAEMALQVANEGGLGLEVFDRPDMAERSMGAMLGVAQGSDEPPKFIVMALQGRP